MAEEEFDEAELQGLGACSECSCKSFKPGTTFRNYCSNTRSDGNKCGHHLGKHK